MSDDDDILKLETQKDIPINGKPPSDEPVGDDAIGIVNGERGTATGIMALPPEPAEASGDSTNKTEGPSASTFPPITIPKIAISPMPARPQQPLNIEVTEPPKPPAAPLQIKIEPQAPTPAAPLPKPEPTAAEFNIFSEKTQVQITNPLPPTKAVPKASPSKVGTFDDKTIVHGSISSISKINIQKKPSPAPTRERLVPTPSRSTKSDISFQTTDNDVDDGYEKRGLSSKFLKRLPKFEVDRKKISVVLGAVAVLMVVFHLFFSTHDEPAAVAVTATEPVAPTAREPASHAPGAPPPIARNPQSGVVRQTSTEFFLHFHATMQKNQN